MPAAISLDHQAITAFCQRWKITRLSLFGSVLRNDFGPESDIDVLVDFADDAKWSLFDHAQMREEFMAIVGRDVDLVSRRAVEQSKNWIRRDAIFSTAEPIYGV